MPHLSPTTLTAAEQRAILRATAKHPRDHLIYSLALGTGLRLGEVVGLDVGDVFAPSGTPRVRVRLRREIAKNGRAGDVFLPDRLVAKLKQLGTFKKRRGEGLSAADPLFCNQSCGRLSKRRVQHAWRTWQKRAGFDRLYPFHCLRHSAVTNVSGPRGTCSWRRGSLATPRGSRRRCIRIRAMRNCRPAFVG